MMISSKIVHRQVAIPVLPVQWSLYGCVMHVNSTADFMHNVKSELCNPRETAVAWKCCYLFMLRVVLRDVRLGLTRRLGDDRHGERSDRISTLQEDKGFLIDLSGGSNRRNEVLTISERKMGSSDFPSSQIFPSSFFITLQFCIA
ncbi:hypothetical protein ANN_03483 [Periplaneta americana]|uniref:Uncharacterized protein n=1 Tax=Periplaneta americana TaxID=6978 RepID=A0ABQ8U3D3_PERAM|nr:hypothetical protein ANN_03483 [Periplaneta americana]